MTFPIRSDALDAHTAILGKTGSGKSNTAKVIVEGALRLEERVCVIDPTGTWYGLRLTPERKPSRFDVIIFGGHHADVPIAAHHGAAIAEIVGTSATSAIIDTRLMKVSERTRFFTDFAETLLRKNSGMLRLVIDEAHLFAPQGKVNDPQSGMMVNAANNLVSLGRGIGLRIVMVSQRPAKLHKDSLTQVETLIAMRLLAPHDRAAINEWIKESADPAQGREIMTSLPSLPTGDAWVWSPHIDLLKRVHFPLASTLDTGRAQEGDEVVLEPLDLETVTGQLASIAAEAKANDPKALKIEIARLDLELKKRVAAEPDPQALKAATEAAFLRGVEEGERRGHVAGQAVALTRVRSALDALHVVELPPVKAETPRAALQPAPQRASAPEPPRPAAPALERVTDDNPGLTLKPKHHQILNALAWTEALRRGAAPTARTTLAFHVGMTAAGGGFNNYLGALRSAGLIDYSAGNMVVLTAAGRSVAEAPALISNQEVQARALNKLDARPQQVLRLLIDHYPAGMTREAIAEIIGMNAAGGGFSNILGRLRSLDMAEYPDRGTARATPFLFPEQVLEAV